MSAKMNHHKWWIIATVLCLAVACIFVVLRKETPEESKVYVPSGDREIVFFYDFPEGTFSTYSFTGTPGTYAFQRDVELALRENDDKDVIYFLMVVINPKNNPFLSETTFDNEESKVAFFRQEDALIKEEMQRLYGLGYKIGLAEFLWHSSKEPYEDTVTRYYPAGYFTKEELAAFPAHENYWYGFYFMKNIDNTPVDPKQGILLDFESYVIVGSEWSYAPLL